MFGRDGFVSVRGLLPPGAVRELAGLIDPMMLDALGAEGASAVGSAPHAERDHLVKRCPALRRTVAFRRCHEVAQELLGNRSAYVYDHAIYKPAHSGGATPWHQDEAYGSNGGRWASAHFWIPLQDVDESNGCLRFVPGSHRLGPRGHATMPGSTSRQVHDVDESLVHVCALRAGDVSIHHPRTLHAAGGNRGEQVRRAWILHFGPWGRFGKLHPQAVAMRLLHRVQAGRLT